MNRQIEVVTYEQDRLCFFVDQVSLAQKKYDRLFKTFKDAPYLSEGAQFLSDAGRELQFYKDVVEMLDKGYRKQSEGCDFCKEGNEKCGTCVKFFDYYEDGGSDRCFTEYGNEKCAYYKPVHHCPNCGARMTKGDSNG